MKDPNYYGVPKDKLGKDLGTIGSIAEGFCIVLDFVLGPLFDTVGRKNACVIGMFTMGICLGLVPFFKSIFPSYCILRCLVGIGALICMNSPLIPDYV